MEDTLNGLNGLANHPLANKPDAEIVPMQHHHVVKTTALGKPLTTENISKVGKDSPCMVC